MTNNPWKEISLDIYEAHMKQEDVNQLQALNPMMKQQVNSYPVKELMILGVAGGNGLEHIDPDHFQTVYGIDINEDYLQSASQRYAHLSNILKLQCIDLCTQYQLLPHADFIVADLLIEYIGIECFKDIIRHVKPKYISCIIQIDYDDEWVSNTAYHDAFQGLQQLHQRIDGERLSEAMQKLSYTLLLTHSQSLPNHKELLRLDFQYND